MPLPSNNKIGDKVTTDYDQAITRSLLSIRDCKF